jgi:nitrogen regulatory protein PII
MERNDELIFEEDDIFSENEYKLVISIVKRGFETDVLEAAKSVGTTGGILLQAKGVSKMKQNFLGFSVNPENTLVMILVKDHLVVPTMKAIYSVTDFKSEAKGMVFALPVSLVAGMETDYEKIRLN